MQKVLAIFLVLIVPLVLIACSGSGKTATGGVPKAPVVLATQVSCQGIEISWDAVPGASHYTVFWGTSPGDYRSMANSNANSVVLCGLQKEQMYYLAVTSWNEFGESNYSGEQFLLYDDEAQNSLKYLAKGEELLQKGYFYDAKVYFSAAISCDPENGEAYQRRAVVHERISRSDLAKEDYARAESIFRKKVSTAAPVRGAFLKN